MHSLRWGVFKEKIRSKWYRYHELFYAICSSLLINKIKHGKIKCFDTSTDTGWFIIIQI